jgi:mannonate dehydratase
VDEVERYRQMGYTAIRAQSGVPGLKSTYGVAKDDKYYEPAERGLPSESLWSTEKYLRHVPKLFEALRKTLGDDLDLLHDVHHRLTPIEAARLGKELEPYHLFWLEDPVAAELQDGFQLIRRHTTTPLAVGEVFNSIWDAEQLIREQLIDYLRMSVVHGGGLTAMKKIADFTAIYHVRTGCHGASDMSPVCMAAALHLDIAINNFGIQEHMLHNAQTEETFPHAYFFRDGSMYPGDGPGLGVDIREDVAAGFPYQRAYLPVNRKEDGTLFHW